jgi:hypothetical protein
MFKKYKLLIPTLVLVILVTWTFINSGTTYTLTIQHYAGLVATIICAISFFAFRQYYKYVLGATLILGLINLFNFTPAQTTTSLNFNSLSIGFQPYSLLVIILTVILAMPKKSEVTTIQSESASKISETQFKEDLEKFRKLYITKSSVDLNEIIEDKRYSDAAKEAARQLLNEKGST